MFFELLEPNLSYNISYNERALEEQYVKISLTRGLVRKGEKIITVNELVEGDKLEKLRSLKQQIAVENIQGGNYVWTVVGYSLMVVVLLIILMLLFTNIAPTFLRTILK